MKALPVLLALISISVSAGVYEVGSGKKLASISAVPWTELQPGDTVLIYWRPEPYKEKLVITRRATAQRPIIIRGVPGPGGELPVMDGNGAHSAGDSSCTNGARAVLQVGCADYEQASMPGFITIENLDVRSGRPPYSFVAFDGSTRPYAKNAAAIYIQRGDGITVRNCRIHDSGNGFFVASSDKSVSQNILVESNYIFDNGIEGSLYEHNNYTAARGIVFQDNHFGPLRSGCPGNNLKDRSVEQVVRYNWIEGGNRQLDLVDAEDSIILRRDPTYRQTYVYGNILIEPEAAGNPQIIHYGGDSGRTEDYRKGTLFLYNNTIVSHRTARTNLVRLSTNDETCDARNNIIYVTGIGSTLALTAGAGTLNLSHNWMKPGWIAASERFTGKLNDDGTTVTGETPGFARESEQDFHLGPGSKCINAAGPLNPAVLPRFAVTRQYVKHQAGEDRANTSDIGALSAARRNSRNGRR